MALQILTPSTTFLAWDDDTHEFLLCTGSSDPEKNHVILGPIRVGVAIADHLDHDALVSADGALKVADWGAHPVMGVDAVGANTYTTVVTAPKQCRYMHVSVSTKAAIISIDGGSTDSFVLPVGESQLFTGLDIPAGAAIQGKNQTLAQNYANLYISVW